MSQYNASDLDVLKGLQPVQVRPGMYTDTTRPNHLAQEVIDNSIDEAQAGYATRVCVVLHSDGSLSVTDDGRGMPVDIHPEEGISGVELILSKLHAGGKFSDKNYQYSGGLHGVGISVVNALSQWLTVEVRRGGNIYEMAFANGVKTQELTVTGKTLKRDTGTTVHFLPNAKYFETANFSLPRLITNLRAKAVLSRNLQVILSDESNEKDYTWQFEDGLSTYIQDAVGDIPTLPEAPFKLAYDDEHGEVEGVFCWFAEPGNVAVYESYANLIPTTGGGTHVNGLRLGIVEALREFCDFRNLIPRGVKITPDDAFEGCQFVLSIKVPDPQFSSQTKERLSSRNVSSWVAGIVKDRFSLWLNANPEESEKIAELVIHQAQKRLKKAKKVVRKKISTGPALPGKLTDCANQDLSETEIFLVEGDSAGGSAKQARLKEFQAVMPLRGKILNTWEVDSGQVLSSQEVHDIAVAIGVDPDSDDLTGLRYGKICILADADSDGAHIATLICALFMKHFKKLVAEGHVFVAMPPLYRIDCGKVIDYALDDAERDEIMQKMAAEKATRGKKITVTRFKGLGEMNPSQLRETTMHPDTRRLVQLVVEDDEMTEEMFDKLLAKKRSGDRKAWLEDKGSLAVID
ncbi:MAG: DNA topoisomerase IV subunit B [Gammaproteobacteria bacterium]|nr:MAG: DNA topoisomerase IV subunit B [Gammaproteobacteria bacterium]